VTGNQCKTTSKQLEKASNDFDFQIAKSIPEYSSHAGSESRFADHYFSSLLSQTQRPR